MSNQSTTPMQRLMSDGYHAFLGNPSPLPKPGDVNGITGKIIVFSGDLVSPLHMAPSDFKIRDIAHSLAFQCRYLGHAAYYYSVAEHSVYVSEYAERRAHELISAIGWQALGFGSMAEASAFALYCARWGLAHDNGEAYAGDLVSPMKALEGFAFFREADERITRLIGVWLGLGVGIPEIVRELDREIIGSEALQLFPKRPSEWKIPPPLPDFWRKKIGMMPGEAELLYLRRFAQLWPEWDLSAEGS